MPDPLGPPVHDTPPAAEHVRHEDQKAGNAMRVAMTGLVLLALAVAAWIFWVGA